MLRDILVVETIGEVLVFLMIFLVAFFLKNIWAILFTLLFVFPCWCVLRIIFFEDEAK